MKYAFPGLETSLETSSPVFIDWQNHGTEGHVQVSGLPELIQGYTRHIIAQDEKASSSAHELATVFETIAADVLPEDNGEFSTWLGDPLADPSEQWQPTQLYGTKKQQIALAAAAGLINQYAGAANADHHLEYMWALRDGTMSRVCMAAGAIMCIYGVQQWRIQLGSSDNFNPLAEPTYAGRYLKQSSQFFEYAKGDAPYLERRKILNEQYRLSHEIGVLTEQIDYLQPLQGSAPRHPRYERAASIRCARAVSGLLLRLVDRSGDGDDIKRGIPTLAGGRILPFSLANQASSGARS